jgi:molybdopterin/thiamine biosynthesis adenylyltransferase
MGEEDQSRFDRSNRLGWFDIEVVRKSNILQVGCGALGNEVAKNLALSGFKKVTFIDMDRVVRSNLNRCVFFTENDAVKNNPKVEPVTLGFKNLSDGGDPVAIYGKIEDQGEDFISGFDVVIGCLDNISTRIHLNAHCLAGAIPYVDGGTRGLVGKVQVVMNGGACLECAMNKTHMKILNLRRSCTGGDMTFHEPKLPNEITTTSIVAAIQVREVLKIVHGLEESVLKGIFYYDGMRNRSEILEVCINPECQVHGNLSTSEGVGGIG